jgi:hypothetical protein
LEKDEDLKDAIISFKIAYANKTKVVWDLILWEREFSKTIRTQEMEVVLNFHAL